MARTAVVAGTATAVSNRVSRRQAERWTGQDPYQQQGYAEPPPPPPPAAPAPGGGDDRVEQLKELAALKQQGVLTEEEFAAEKARVLAG
ncbi:MAG: SHOCT domain-containing protein [Thermoleophilaceae bacterium]|nr:SHOCT domain-containing protein [Thermoleophilaceae bacterium]